MKYPALVEPKLDGETGIWYYKHPGYTQACLVNKYGKIRWNFPAVAGFPNVSLIGELHEGLGFKGSLYDLNSNKTSDSLHFTVFDIIEKGSLLDRREHLFQLVPHHQIIEAKLALCKKDVMAHYQWYIGIGFEGVVVKSLDSTYCSGPCGWVKIKAKDRSYFPLLFIDPVKERIEVKVTSQVGTVVVGVKTPNDFKKILVNMQLTPIIQKPGTLPLMGSLEVEIEHQGILPSGSLRHPVITKGVRYV